MKRRSGSAVWALLLIAIVALAGCQSKQDRLTQLETSYNAQLMQYTSDCSDVIEDPPTSPRIASCKAEQDRMRPTFEELKALNTQLASSKQ